MKTFILLSARCGMLLTLIALGCSTEPGATTELFKVKVDSLQRPQSVAVGDTITIRLFGVIGGDACHSFSHFQVSRLSLRLDLTVWGKLFPGGTCAAVMMYLNGVEYKILASQRGTFRINIHQQDGSTLVDSIQVE